MAAAIRVLVGSPLGKLYELGFASTGDFEVVLAVDPRDVRRAISGRVRFDVVLTDLIWDNRESEFAFDGFDVLEVLRTADRLAPVLFAIDGRRTEQDHLDEARLRPDVAGVYTRASGAEALLGATKAAALGRREPLRPSGPPSLYELFRGRKGDTAGRLAGAIAAGRASDNATLGLAAHVALHTANKVTTHYLGPIIEKREEHDPTLPMTLPAIYRWCGLHAHYLISWCRRNGHDDVVRPMPRRAELTVVFDPSDPACVQDRSDHPQRDFQLRLRATNTGKVALTEVRSRLKAGHDSYGRIRHDNTPPYDRSRNGITLQPRESDYFDIAFCHLDQPQMVLQYADEHLLREQTINQTPKAKNTPVEVTFEARREDTNEPIPTVTSHYMVAPDGDAITLNSGGR